MHPKRNGKVVAEGNAGVNKRSRCVDLANEKCGEGEQFITVVRLLYKNTPVMFDSNTRCPSNIGYMDQVEGMPNMPILWCISHIIEIPPFEQIMRLLGEFIQPLSQKAVHSDSDFEDTTKKRNSVFNDQSGRKTRRGRPKKPVGSIGQSSKVSRGVPRAGNA